MKRSLDALDMTDRAFFRRGFPHEAFTMLRREAPVWWQAPPTDATTAVEEGFWVLSKYDDIERANRDTELFTAIDGPQLLAAPEIRGKMLLSMDGSDHARLRKLISAGFTPRMVSRLENQSRAWASSILDDALERGRIDFVETVAYPLPMHMIADIMGVPREDRPWVFAKANDVMMCTDPEYPVPREDQTALQIELFEYAQGLSRDKRHEPADDIWTRLCTVEVDADDGTPARLASDELDLFFILLVIAGSETTRNAISHGLLALTEFPDQMAVLRDRGAIGPAVVDEIIRWASPVSYFARRASRDTEIRGTRISEGDRIAMFYPSGNRDEDQIADPFRFDVTRTPNYHLAFGGGGPHFCLGASLARMNIAILFEELLARTRDVSIAGEPQYSVQGIGNPISVSIKNLQVELA